MTTTVSDTATDPGRQAGLEPGRAVKQTYGTEPSQYGSWLPAPPTSVLPTLVLIHGGYFSNQFTIVLESRVAKSLNRHGYAVYNAEYRRFGEVNADGSPVRWPEPGQDGAAAIRRAAQLRPGHPIIVVAHSAGAALAAWAVKQVTSTPLPSDPQLLGLVSRAGALNFGLLSRSTSASLRALSAAAGVKEMSQADELLAQLDPIAQLPLGCPTVAIHGTADSITDPVLSETFVAAANELTPGGAELVWVDGAEHNTFLDPGTEAHAAVLSALAGLSAAAGAPAGADS